MINRIRIGCDRILEPLLAALMALLVIDVLWQVFTRFALQDASSFTEELARFLLMWISLLGAAYVSGQGKHLAVDIFPQYLKRSNKRIANRAIQAAILTFAVLVLLGGGLRLVWVTLYLGQSSAALGIPLGLIYTVLPISGALMAFYSIADLAKTEA